MNTFLHQVGTATLDLQTSTLHINQYLETSRSYQNTLTMLEAFQPSALILPVRMANIEDGRLSFSSFVHSGPFSEYTKVRAGIALVYFHCCGAYIVPS